VQNRLHSLPYDLLDKPVCLVDGKRRFMTASLIPTAGVWAAAAGSLPPVFDEAIIRMS